MTESVWVEMISLQVVEAMDEEAFPGKDRRSAVFGQDGSHILQIGFPVPAEQRSSHPPAYGFQFAADPVVMPVPVGPVGTFGNGPGIVDAIIVQRNGDMEQLTLFFQLIIQVPVDGCRQCGIDPFCPEIGASFE